MIKRLPYSSLCARVLLAACVSLGVTGQAQAQISSPSDIGDLVFWVDATDVNGTSSQPADGSTVTNWTDKSVGGNDLIIQAGTATFEVTGFDGANPGIRLPVGARFLAGNPFSGVTQNATTIFFVNSNVTQTNNASMSLNGSIGATPGRFFFHTPWNDNNAYFDAGAANGPNRLQGPFPNALTETTLYTGLNDETGGSQQLRIDGQPLVSDTTGHTVTVSGGIRLGSIFNGRYAEVVIYDRALSQSEMEDVECYLLLKWKPTNLPTVCTTTAVTNTNDSGIGSLRNAITAANSNVLLDNITFDIPGTGPHLISLASQLPDLTDAGITIDGTTQSGASCGNVWAGAGHSLMVQIDGSAGTNMRIDGADITIRGLSITGATGNGIIFGLASGNATIQCNYIGLAPDGSAAGNATDGLRVNGYGHLIGGAGPTDGNVISGNLDKNVHFSNTSNGNHTIEGNFVGPFPGGLTAPSPQGNGVWNSYADNLVVDRNLISGLGGYGVVAGPGATPVGNIITNNYIGTTRTGNALLSNGNDNIHFNLNDPSNGAGMTIGTPGNGNVIAGTSGRGMYLDSASGLMVQGNNIGVGADGVTNLSIGTVGITLGSGAQGAMIGGTGAGEGNIIANTGEIGIRNDVADVSILGNIIFNTGLEEFTVLNAQVAFPTVTAAIVDGTTLWTELTSDVAAGSHRVEVFKVGTPTGLYGDARAYLGSFNIDHTGSGVETFSDSFTSAAIVAAGDQITATLTQATSGAAPYGATSELAVNGTVSSPLTVLNTNNSGAGSLRDAITFANANAAEDDITFDIPGTGPFTISPISALPSITDDGIGIDGITQSGASCGQLTTGTPHTLMIRVDGLSAGGTIIGFNVTAQNSSLRGLSITGFTGRGISINGAADNNLIECSYIGVETDGETKGPNVRAIPTPPINIGPVTGAAVRNSLISGNDYGAGDLGIAINGVTNFTLEGNIIGLNASGTTVLPNGNYGVYLLGSNDNVTLGGITPETRNVISGNGSNGIYVASGSSNIDILGNYIGTDITGAVDLGNTADGIFLNGSTNVTIGGTAAGAENIISGNTGRGVHIAGGASNITLLGNHVGVAADGSTAVPNAGGSAVRFDAVSSGVIGGTAAGSGNVISGNAADGILIYGGSSVTILGNFIGTDSTGTVAVGNGDEGIVVEVSNATATIGDGTSAGRNVIAGNGGSQVYTRNTSSFDLNNNLIGIGVGGENLGGTQGAHAGPAGTMTVRNNVIANLTGNGVLVQSTNSVGAIYANSIFDNDELGIDLANDDLTANDSGDGDTGANDLLNYPLINSLSSNGATTLSYDLDLDVPVNTDGYRIEFFANSAPDATNGEGETYLGFFDTGNHAGGNITYNGSLTASQSVSVGTIISATTTRKTATSFDITSEFSVNRAAISSLVVTNTNDSGAGSLRNAIAYANANASEDAITFDIPDAGPHTITLASALPSLTDDGVSIDGTTQSGATCGDLWAGTPHTLQVSLSMGGLGGFDALTITGDDVSIKGLSIVGDGGGLTGVWFPAGTENGSITCSYLGLNPDGTANALATGVAARGINITIGGNGAGDGNVISSSQNGIFLDDGAFVTTIEGNFIGTDPLGGTPRPNTGSGVIVNSGTTVTVDEIRRNLISGNLSDGIDVPSGTTMSALSGDVVIAGNYIGVDRTGSSALPNGGGGINFDAGAISGVTIGGTNSADRNIISGNTGYGVNLSATATDITFLGNYIGLNAAGTAAIPNDGAAAIYVTNVTDMTIGNGTAAGRNILHGETTRILELNGTLSNISIHDNYFGTDVTGNTALGGGLLDHFIVGNITNFDILDNVFGPVVQESMEFWGGTADDVVIRGNHIGVGADGATAFANGRTSRGAISFGASHSSTNLVIGGTGVGEGNIIANARGPAIAFESSGSISGQIVGNTIRDNDGNGINVQNITSVAIYSNSIHSNGGLGIDLGNDGVTANDGGDSDTGPNDLLNYPLINHIAASGTTLSYDLDLDVPSNTDGYRIEFFANSAPDTTNGEGEIFLGFFDTGNHAGGTVSYNGSLTASQSVSVGTIISATTTRKTATSFDITSEFSVNKAVTSSLVVTNTNDSGAGSLRDAITFANANAAEDDITFAIPGTGPHTITPTTGLPHITDNGISIDGTTQSGASCGNLWSGTPHTLMIEIDFSAYSGNGLTFLGDDSEIRGLSLTGASVSGLYTPSDRFTLTCSYIGLAPDGTENGHTYGIAPRGADHVIGGSNVGDGNVISGNSGFGIIVVQHLTNLTIEGNFIGTDPTGMAAAANGQYGISNVGGITGTPTVNAIRKNLISGNVAHGIYLENSHVISGASGNVIIAGNYIGVDRTGNVALPNGGDGINFAAGSISGVTIGGTTAADRNIISGNTSDGLEMSGVSDVSLFGNYIGVDAAGTGALANGQNGVNSSDMTTLTIGNGAASGRNVIAGNGNRGIAVFGTNADILIDGNYIGTDVSGNIRVGNAIDQMKINAVTNLDIVNNVMGGGSQEGIEFWLTATSDNIVIQGNNIGVGADGASDIGAGRTNYGYILFGNGYSASNIKIGGTGAGEGNIIANDAATAILINSNSGAISGEIVGNQIFDNAGDGIAIEHASSTVAIYSNRIYSNGGLGIDLGTNAVTANDNGDGDTGPNDLLNFPVINSVSGAGTTMSYDIDLDTVSNANGYRIDFYTNSAADPTGYGEGETHLGFIDVSHGGGNQSFTGTFTGTQAIAQGEIISATTTRKTGVSSYDATSEFSLAYTSDAATELTAAKTVDVFDPTSAGLYALPGNDIISSMTVTNIGNSAADANSIVIIDAVPSEMEFYNGDMDDGGPANDPIYFTQTGGANLTFNHATDAAYSNSPTRPSNMAGCTYTPSAGYDSNVTYVCFNPKGAMASGNPDPTFTAQFRARIK